jgi:hypothetical protein
MRKVPISGIAQYNSELLNARGINAIDIYHSAEANCRGIRSQIDSLNELLWDFVNVDVERPDAETAQAQACGNIHMLTHAVAR